MTETPTLRLGTRGEYSDGQHWAFLMLGETCVGAVEDMTPEAMAALESALDPSWAETILEQRDAAIEAGNQATAERNIANQLLANVREILWPPGGARKVPHEHVIQLPEAVTWLLDQRVALTELLDEAERRRDALREALTASEAECAAAIVERDRTHKLVVELTEERDEAWGGWSRMRERMMPVVQAAPAVDAAWRGDGHGGRVVGPLRALESAVDIYQKAPQAGDSPGGGQ